MTHRFLLLVALLIGICRQAAAAEPEHVVLYYEKGKFGGWPANHGIWSWGDEILVGFSAGDYQDLGNRHNINRQRPEYHRLARSLDGGKTWKIEAPQNYLLPEGKALHGVEPPEQQKLEWRENRESIPFNNPDFAMALRMTDVNRGPSRFAFSLDRGHSWKGPFRFPNLETPGIAARTDYQVIDSSHLLVFLTAGKIDGKEGRPLVAETTDGGRSWSRKSWIGPEPDRGFAIMPSSARLSEKQLFVAIRRSDGTHHWIQGYFSGDLGSTWEKRVDPVADTGTGNPPSLIRLRDGRLCLTYGVRAKPFRMAARLSSDAGRSWSEERVLRDDGSSTDIGYPRSVQRTDGKVVTLYYFSDAKTGPERYIAATIWEP